MDIRAALQEALAGAYRIDGVLEGGGMSRVFVAEELALGRQVVIKVLAPELAEAVSVERFKREIAWCARLHHPHLVPLLTAGDIAGLPYYTMPFVRGESLRALLRREGAMPVDAAVRILRDVVTALAYAHAEGIIHRDIKPDNVLLTAGSASVTDFGVAKALDASAASADSALTTVGARVGTPGYVAPEQATGDRSSDHRVDLYSVGAMAYEMLAGFPPFRGTPHEVIEAHIARAPEPLSHHRPDLPDALLTLVMQCLEKRPGDRPESAAVVLATLEAIPTGMPAAGGPVVARNRDRSQVRSAYVRIAGLILLFGVGVVLAKLNLKAMLHSDAPVASTTATDGAGAAVDLIAVLPFTLESADTALRYLADGTRDEVMSRLATFSGFRLLAPEATRAVAGDSGAGEQPLRDLGVTKTIEGTVRVRRDSAQIAVRIADAVSGQGLWTASEQGARQDMQGITDRVMASITEALSQSLTPEDTRRATHRTRVNPAAYDLFLRSRPMLGADPQAVNLLQAAIALDPTFARAYAALSIRYTMLGNFGDGTMLDSARVLARRALALDPTCDAAHIATAAIAAYSSRLRDARVSFLRALELAPSVGDILLNLSVVDAFLGRFDDEVHWAVRGLALSPNVGTSHYFVALALINAGDYSAAERFLTDALRRFPETARLHIEQAALDAFEGRDSLAMSRMRAAAARWPENMEVQWHAAAIATITGAADAESIIAPLAARKPTGRIWHGHETLRTMYAFALMRRGERHRADSLFAASVQAARTDIAAGVDKYDRPLEIAAIHAIQGDADAAMSWLERAYEAGYRQASPLLRDPFFASLSANPAFQRLVDRMRTDANVMVRRAHPEYESLIPPASR